MPSTYWVASSLPATLKKRLNSCRKSVPLGHSSTNFLYHSCSSATSIAQFSFASSQLNCCPILAPGDVREQGSVLPPGLLPMDSLGEGPLPPFPPLSQALHHLLANRTGWAVQGAGSEGAGPGQLSALISLEDSPGRSDLQSAKLPQPHPSL